METILEEMQEGIEQLELTPETEDSILISLAGLKQVSLLHDLRNINPFACCVKLHCSISQIGQGSIAAQATVLRGATGLLVSG